MGKRIQGLIIGLALGLTIPAAAEVTIHCRPVLVEPCNPNMLAMHFQTHGHIPNRCKVS